ncbi:exonuclease SbcC [Caloramator fervidus]|uniref:Nuclease SbcCD subunit C n=1 Tax=Caloramator fervidus TaxID=29344 RepID=A0A1H5S7H3_9CLOT|nr:AAA family ATPase [Caloramator fervidus]SEF46485.1 exonuclease SbcC [Caloramator fervidus]
MRYIKSIEIENFQSHKYTKIDFINGLNIITGPSDNGKTAIIRALKWVLYNEPKGSDFIRQGENTCRVSITLDNDIKITRKKYKNKNTYIITYPNGEETRFEGFGNDIPPEVLKEHGIRKIYIDPSSIESINISEQLDAPFMLSKSGPIKAKAIGKLVGVHYVDTAIKLVDKDILNIENQKKQRLDKINELKLKLNEFENLNLLLDYLKNKEEKINKIKSYNEKLKKLMELKTNLDNLYKETLELEQTLSQFTNINRAEYDLLNLDTKIKDYNLINNYHLRIFKINEELINTNKLFSQTKNIDKIEDYYKKLTLSIKTLISLKEFKEKYDDVIKNLNSLKKLVDSLSNLEKIHQNYYDLEKKHTMLLQLKAKLKEYKEISNRILVGQDFTKNFNEVNKAMLLLENLNYILVKYNKISEILNKFKSINLQLNEYKKQVTNINSELDFLINEYANNLKKLGRCPVCLSKIQDNVIEYIINELRGVGSNE